MTFDSKDELHKIRRLLDSRAKAKVSKTILAALLSSWEKGQRAATILSASDGSYASCVSRCPCGVGGAGDWSTPTAGPRRPSWGAITPLKVC